MILDLVRILGILSDNGDTLYVTLVVEGYLNVVEGDVNERS